MVKTYDCGSGGAQFCQGCYTMEEQEPCTGFPRGTGDWVRLEDYERLEQALLCLLPGLVLDRRYADADDDIDALNSRIETVQSALYPTENTSGAVIK